MAQKTSGNLDHALQEANTAIASSATYKATASEGRLNSLGNKVSGVVQGEYASVAQSDAAASAFSLVKEGVVNFAENSKILMSALDEVAKLHPVVQVAVSLFKAALTLELTRRENDDKVLALNATMCDMMSILTLLKRVASAKELDAHGLTIEDRLLQRMTGIIESIKVCAKTCDSYHKRNLTIKIFTSTKWKAKFTDVAQQFVDHKAGLQLDLQMHASIGIAATAETLATMSQNVEAVMDMVFELMRTPEERELANFVSSRPGGAAGVLKNSTFLAQVLAKQRPARGDSLAPPAQVDEPFTVERLQREVAKDIESVVRENQFFEQKFEAMRIQLDEVRVTIRHETDRMIDAVLSGPHERIIDRDLYHIWKEMGWKGSVKAKHLVMAVRDHFAEESHAALAVIRDLTEDGDPELVARKMSQVAEVARRTTPLEDAWALQYITVSRVQPLIEAIDNDVSSFVTVTEVNAFTSARPAAWSLPRWIAYWTFGFEMTMQWYTRRIRALFARIHFDSRCVLPTNRLALSTFVSSPQVSFVENLLSGLHTSDGRAGADWDWDSAFAKFKSYVVDHENQLAKRLQRVKYFIDEANTLTTLIVGSERPETYALPLVFLLLKRSLFVIQQAAQVKLHEDELAIIQCSLQVIWATIGDRVSTLRAMFKFQNLHNTEQLENFSFGLYSYVFDPPKMGPFWERDPAMDIRRTPTLGERRDDRHITTSGQESDPGSDDLPLCYGPQVEELDAILDERCPTDAVEEDESVDTSENEKSLVGPWSGTYTYGNGIGSDGLVSFSITTHASDGTIAGSGKDACGPFSIRGFAASDGQIAFIKDYAMLQSGEKVFWYYEAEAQDDLLAIDGSWGLPRSIIQARRHATAPTSDGPTTEIMPPPGSKTDALMVLGSFTLKRRPVEYFLACPPAEEFARNRSRALWTLAINVAIHAARARSGRLDWAALRARRELRERYVELTVKRLANKYRLGAQEEREREELLKEIHPDDLHLWGAMSLFRRAREVSHRSYSCSVCRSGPIFGGRLVCADCTTDVGKTTDFCHDCFSGQGHARQPSHTVVQFRSTPLRIYLLAILNAAKRMFTHCADNSPAHDGSPCAECQCAINAAEAYWCCLDCDSFTYVCAVCNTRIEHEKPWLRERLPNADYAHIHDWSHSLVLTPAAEGAATQARKQTSIEDRLALLETRLDGKLSDVDARLTNFQSILAQVLSGLGSLGVPGKNGE